MGFTGQLGTQPFPSALGNIELGFQTGGSIVSGTIPIALGLYDEPLCAAGGYDLALCVLTATDAAVCSLALIDTQFDFTV